MVEGANNAAENTNNNWTTKAMANFLSLFEEMDHGSWIVDRGYRKSLALG